MAPQSYLNTLKSHLNAVLFGGRAADAQPAEPEAAPAAIDGNAAQALSGLGHFRIPLLEPPGEGWVYVGDGELRRVDKLTDYECQRENLLAPVAKRVVELYLALAQLKADWNQAFDAIELLNEPKQTGRVKKGKKPSLTLYLLDRSISLSRQRSDIVRYEQDIVLRAKKLLEACFDEWSGDGADEVKQTFEIAFTKNPAGQYSRASMLKLQRIQSKDPRWQEAMGIIKSAEIPDGMASYLTASVRDKQGKYHPIPLDMASVREWPLAGLAVLKPVKPIRSEADFQNVRAEINDLMAATPERDSPDGERLDVLLGLADCWARRKVEGNSGYPFPVGD